MKRNLNEMSLGELQSLQRRVAARIVAKRERLKRARTRIAELAAKAGVTVRELMATLRVRGPDKVTPRKRLEKQQEVPKVSIGKAPPRKIKVSRAAWIVNPDNPTEKWGGKGRPPNWYKTARANGKLPGAHPNA